MEFKETKVNCSLVCSNQCRMVLDLTTGVKFYLKRSMLPCFGSWNHNGEILPFKAFKSIGNHGKRALYVRILFANSIPVIIQWHESCIACISTNVCKTSADTQKAVLEKNDHDGYECKYERSCVNLTLLSVRFLFLSKVQSFLSFDGRCALCFGKTRHIASR